MYTQRTANQKQKCVLTSLFMNLIGYKCVWSEKLRENKYSFCDIKRYTEIVKIFVSLTDYPNALGKDGHSQSYFAAKNGNSEIV